MSASSSVQDVDLLIFGGGAAGLWLLDEARRAGIGVLLFDCNPLGTGQTIASQGIIHGGLKYTLNGLLNPSAKAIRTMPSYWQACLNGDREPNLLQVRMRAASCYLWRTDSLTSRVAMIGARAGLSTAPEEVSREHRPAVLRDAPGIVASIREPVIDPRSFIETLHDRQPDRIALYSSVASAQRVNDRWQVTLTSHDQTTLQLRAGRVVFAAGQGNSGLREAFRLAGPRMQRRPLHMTLLRGSLPVLNGHCVDGAKTRVTITSDSLPGGEVVWQVGGQVSEDGVGLETDDLIAHVARELRQVLPGCSFDDVRWSTYRVDRAESIMPGFRRPDDVQIIEEKGTITAWPTKLALAPRLAERILDLIPKGEVGSASVELEGFRTPEVACLPWEEEDRSWTTAH